MESEVMEFECKNCGLIWARELTIDIVKDFRNLNMFILRCPGCKYGS